MVSRVATPQPARAHLGAVQPVAHALSSPSCAHWPLEGGSRWMIRTSFGKSRVRENRTLSSVGATPNGLATRPDPGDEPATYFRIYRRRGRLISWPARLIR